MHKLRTYSTNDKGKIFSILALMMGLGMSILFPIFPNYIKDILNTDESVSIFYAGMAVISIIASLLSTIIFRKLERTTITKISFLALGIAAFRLIFATKTIELIIWVGVLYWFDMFLLIVLGLFVRDFAKASDLGREEGKYYKYQNIGYLIGPLLGGLLAVYLNYELVFLLASAIFMAGLVYFSHQHMVANHKGIINKKSESKGELLLNIKNYFSNKERTKTFITTVALMGWFIFKRLYIPLYVVESGYLESVSGIILALAIIPFIFLEIPIGEYADKKGIRLPTAIGFLIIGLSLVFVFLSPFVMLNFAILILVNIGAAIIEPLEEFHLFKNMTQKEEENLYGIYMTADPLAYFLIPAIGAGVLLFLPFKFLFLTCGALMLLISGFSWITLKNS